jgi:hypothetical protein
MAVFAVKRRILCKILGFHSGDYEKYYPLAICLLAGFLLNLFLRL